MNKNEKYRTLETIVEKQIQENSKISIEHTMLTGNIKYVLAHPSTTEIIKIIKRGSIPSFPVNKANVYMSKEIFRLALGHVSITI